MWNGYRKVGRRLIIGWKFDLGGRDLATARMEEINPNLGSGCLTYLAAINQQAAIRPVLEEQPG